MTINFQQNNFQKKTKIVFQKKNKNNFQKKNKNNFQKKTKIIFQCHGIKTSLVLFVLSSL